MRNLVLVFCLFLVSFFGNSQKLNLSVTESVLKQRALSPVRIVGFSWIPNSQKYSYLSNDAKTLYSSDLSQDSEQTIITLTDLNKLIPEGKKLSSLYGYEWQTSDKIIWNNGQFIFSYAISTKSLVELKTMGVNFENSLYQQASNQLAYTIENNVYLDGKAITKNTNKNIVSGQAIARSEFGISGGLFWSTKGSYLAFYQKDETDVADYPLLDITTTPGSLHSIKYPMAGQKSEKPRVGIYATKKKKTYYISPKSGMDSYLTNFCFTPDENYCLIAEVNRAQNEMDLNVYDLKTGKWIKTILQEKNSIWVEPEHPAYFYGVGNDFIWMSEKDGFMNLYKVDFEGKPLESTPLTTHKFVVKEILETDPNGKFIYYSATGENPTNTLVYRVDMMGNSEVISKSEGTHRFSLSSDGIYFYDGYSSISKPNHEMIYTSNGKMAKLLKDSENPMLGYNLGIAELGSIKGKDGSDLHYRMIKPSNFNPNQKYPVLVYVYGGPHAQMVVNSFNAGSNLWMNWMAEQGYIVFTLDNRGSGERGFAFESQIHRQLGTIEMEDQISGVDFLKSLPYVDGERLAVHGWSFGGFMTTSLMLRQPDIFKVGVAGGPVTDWKYYEIMYGERYMDRPEENKEGYEGNSLLNYTKNLKGDLLLIHGTVDDVVVMQHNYSLVKKFVEDGIQMNFFPYPMHKHNVTGKDRAHLMEKILTYIIDHNK